MLHHILVCITGHAFTLLVNHAFWTGHTLRATDKSAFALITTFLTVPAAQEPMLVLFGLALTKDPKGLKISVMFVMVVTFSRLLFGHRF